MTQHEVMSSVANLNAIQEDADMMRVGVLSAFMQALVNGVETGITTVFAVVDALVHLRSLIFVNVRHRDPFVCVFECELKTKGVPS